MKAKGLDGEEVIITDVVSKLTKYIYATTAQRRDIDLDDFIHGFHNSKGEEFEMTEQQVQFIKEQAENVYPMLTTDTVTINDVAITELIASDGNYLTQVADSPLGGRTIGKRVLLTSGVQSDWKEITEAEKATLEGQE